MKEFHVYPAKFIQVSDNLELEYVDYGVLWFKVLIDRSQLGNGPLIPMIDPQIETGSGVFERIYLDFSMNELNGIKKTDLLFSDSNCTVVVSSDLEYHISQVELVLPKYLKHLEFREVNENFVSQLVFNLKESQCNK